VKEEYLTLKWGSLKSWNFNSDEAKSLLEEYFERGVSMSAAFHHDDDRQKEIVIELIDIGDFDTVYLDWDATEVTKQEAKDYVINYGQLDA
jgi:hypothetical protein